MPQNIELKNEDAWARQLEYFRTHLDVAAETMFSPLKLNWYQKIIIRSIGNDSEIQTYASRGAGKSYCVAIALATMCVLYPGTKVIAFAPTAPQAAIVLSKLKDLAMANPNLCRELVAYGKNVVSVSRTGGSCRFKNGSTIEALAINSARGRRGKIVLIDEVCGVDLKELQSVITPISNYTRDCCITQGLKDYTSKLINITSCFPKINEHYEEVERIIKEIKNGRRDAFIVSLSHTAAELAGLTSPEFFEKERRRMPEITFAMEYQSRFPGNNGDSCFPFSLVESCRTLQDVEISQPKNSKSRYVMSVDLAVANNKNSDNTVISILKFTQGSDEFMYSELVYMKSFKGEGHDKIAEHIKKLVYVSFPNIEKINYDSRGLGMTFDRFFIKPFSYNGKEYPPLCKDTDKVAGANDLLHPINANNSDNIRFYNNFRMALEQQRISLPVSSSFVKQKIAEIELSEDKDDDEDNKAAKFTFEQKAILFETDALAVEMGDIREIKTASGSITYDVPQGKHHKDRYSSVAMALDYVIKEEEKAIRKNNSYCGAIIDDEDDFKSSWGNFNSFRYY